MAENIQSLHKNWISAHLELAIPEYLEYVGGMTQTETDHSVQSICDLLGRREIAARVGRGVTAVSNAAVDGKFPASWFVVISEMCAAADIQCHPRHFNFVSGGVAPETSSTEVNESTLTKDVPTCREVTD